MAIYNIGQSNQALKNYGVENWSKSIELGNKIDLTNSPDEVSKGDGQSFGDFLANSIAKVNDLQHDADNAVQKLASGESKNLHETLLAVERADIAFKQMNQVRLKVLDAYKEIMKMQV